MFTKKVVAASIATVAVVLLMSAPVLAGGGKGQNNSGDGPGWGYGGERPGWGYGDTNHTHTGPPGQSR